MFKIPAANQNENLKTQVESLEEQLIQVDQANQEYYEEVNKKLSEYQVTSCVGLIYIYYPEYC